MGRTFTSTSTVYQAVENLFSESLSLLCVCTFYLRNSNINYDHLVLTYQCVSICMPPFHFLMNVVKCVFLVSDANLHPEAVGPKKSMHSIITDKGPAVWRRYRMEWQTGQIRV